MKRIMNCLLSMFLSLCCFCAVVLAEEMPQTNEIEKEVKCLTFDDNYTVEDALKEAYDGELEYGDWRITKSTLQTGIDYAEKQNTTNGGEKIETEEWVIINTETLVPYRALQGQYKTKIGVGMSSSVSYSITVSGSVQGFPLSASASFSMSGTRSGPNGTELVGSYYATHRYYCAVASGSVTRYTYRVQDPISGAYIRTEYRTYVTNKNINDYGVFAYLNAGTNMVTYRSVGSSATRTFNENTFIGYLNSTSVWYHINF